jgi:hypothetical protein
MKRIVFVAALVLVNFGSCHVTAEEVGGTVGTDGNKSMYDGAGSMILGGYLGFGITSLLGNGHIFFTDVDPNLWTEDIRKEDRTAKFAGGGCVYFDYYIAPFWAVEAGIGFTTTGARYKGRGDDGEFKSQLRFMNFEIPLMAKLNYENFQATAGFVFSVALSGVESHKDDASNVAARWGSSRWDPYNRVNFGPRLGVGYAIEVGPINIVPSITWSIHLVDELNDGDIETRYDDSRSHRFRAMNLMFNGGVEWGLPI